MLTENNIVYKCATGDVDGYKNIISDVLDVIKEN